MRATSYKEWTLQPFGKTFHKEALETLRLFALKPTKLMQLSLCQGPFKV